jgi:serine/threonine protein kinase
MASDGNITSAGVLKETITNPTSSFTNMRADPSSVQLEKMVSQGSFGSLYKGTWRGTPVAVKQLRLELADDPVATKDFKTEISLLSLLRHPNIILYMGAFEGTPKELKKTLGDKDLPLIVFEWLEGGNLYNAIHGPKSPSLTKIIQYAWDLACGMNFLHTHDPKIIHRDLKPQNLLLDSSGNLKIGDFGLSRFKSESESMTGHTGSYRWMAPEVVRNEKYDEKVDVYSFGIILWEMIASDVPFSNLTDMQAAMNTSNGMRPALPPSCTPNMKDLIRACWAPEPSERPSFQEVLDKLQVIKREMAGKKEGGGSGGEKACCILS